MRPPLLAAIFALTFSATATASATQTARDVMLNHSFFHVSFERHPAGIVLAIGLESIFDVSIEPADMVVAIRRIDGTVRPWRRLVAEQTGLVPNGSTIRFAVIPDVPGSTYEIAIDRGRALSWRGQPPAQSEIDAVDDQHDLQCDSCQIGAPAKQIALLTIPSYPVASPDDALRRLRAEFLNHEALVIRGSPTVHIDSTGPHTPDQDQPEPVGAELLIRSIDRAAVGTTSVGPLGVPPSAHSATGLRRYALDAVSLGTNFGTMAFASPAEMRMYMRSVPR